MHALRRPRHPLLPLALLAALLLALVPSLGRLWQAAHEDPLLAQLDQLCTADGLASSHGLARWLAGSAEPPQDPSGHGHGGDDCDYCPLLAHAATPPPPLGVVPPAAPAPTPFVRPATLRLRARHLLGWAPRGPPAAA
ncbi:DUF2946 family protein [Thermomonas flagellata]|uniref:DUF2946 family protein n=1 Tax=Thermomonas flagellata TaxID=2888524 RepID=UPI001F04F36B|nr:DUF2946 family protein [Thermomonas flagellata]